MSKTPHRRYIIDLDDATIDALVQGICPETLAQRAFQLLGWRREAIRATTKERTDGRRRSGSAPSKNPTTQVPRRRHG